MIQTGLSVTFDPDLPWAAMIGLGTLAVALLMLGLLRRARGIVGRTLILGMVWLALANPVLVREKRSPQPDTGIVIVDDSPSQSIGDRRAQTEAALAHLERMAGQIPNLTLKIVHAGAARPGSDDGTRLFDALDRALADIPRARYAGAVFLTDGQVHDVPPTASAADRARLPPGPIHALLTGHPAEQDRRLVVVQAPTYALLDHPAIITLRVEDDSAGNLPVAVRMTKDGGEPHDLAVPANRDFTIELPIEHGGQTVVVFTADPGPHSLTPLNKRAAVAINGIRDRLRVLLISGEPHPGERTWRNLLKADPSVDLVHFTILRPPEKQDGTPINELSLIAFPIRELFEVKLTQFDLIIFDRYQRRNILPRIYLEAVVRYVQDGGAVLDAAGPGYASAMSLYDTPLGEILPGEPSGRVIDELFRPHVTDLGARHPVTAGLDRAGQDRAGLDQNQPGAEPRWGRWTRQVDVDARHGEVLMTGAEGRPLLLLDRIEKGRVAQLESDQIWLWSRGYNGGGPQAELLRRLAHWLMKEPDLEEEDLRAEANGGRLNVIRQSLSPAAVPVKITDPLGTVSTLDLTQSAPGRWTASTPAELPGLYRVEDGTRSALAAVGAVNPREFSDVRATPEKLAPVAAATGGGIFWIGDHGGPDLRMVRTGATASGHDWFGFVRRGDYEVIGFEQVPLLPPFLILGMAMGGLMLAWWREGR